MASTNRGNFQYSLSKDRGQVPPLDRIMSAAYYILITDACPQKPGGREARKQLEM